MVLMYGKKVVSNGQVLKTKAVAGRKYLPRNRSSHTPTPGKKHAHQDGCFRMCSLNWLDLINVAMLRWQYAPCFGCETTRGLQSVMQISKLDYKQPLFQDVFRYCKQTIEHLEAAGWLS
mmetsp:Transcript_1823/g.3795  ORF Transcript_1823/g.3795 Transcript_1823/m.3795 type:complete len:119 (-) Transcript_1823:596-952(-)